MGNGHELQRFKALPADQSFLAGLSDIHQLADLAGGPLFHVAVHGLGVGIGLKEGRQEGQA